MTKNFDLKHYFFFIKMYLKKMKPLKLLLFLAILLVSNISCFGPGVRDFSTELTSNYSIFRSSAHEIMITPNDGWNDEIAIIPSKVLRVNVYKNFIIAERQGLKRRSPYDKLDTYKIPDEKIKDYWILDTSNNFVIGNLKVSSFRKKLDSLKIPSDIKLIDVNKY